jgi:DNA (cytosine-5)-methyltransferase 1
VIYGSVCSGIEAASVAWHPLGWRAAFYSEIDPFPRSVLSHHYPDVPLHGDFTTINAGDYAAIDVLVGGTPCQSFSVAGLRGGMADERGNLALEYLRLADRLRPRWVVWENVPGVLSSAGGRDFGAFLGGLAELGYGWAYRVLDAQYFGLAQRRKRVFVVGCAGDWRGAAAVLFERHGLSGHPAPRRSPRKGSAARAASSVALRGREGGATAELGDDCGLTLRAAGGGGDKAHVLIAQVCPTLRAGGNKTGGDRPPGTDVDTCDSLIPVVSKQPVGGLVSTMSGEDIAPCLIKSMAAAVGNTQDAQVIAVTHSLRAEGFDASEDGTGRGTPLAPITFGAQMSVPQTDVDMCQTLQAKNPMAVAFTAKDYGGDASEEVSPTLRSGSHAGSHANGGVMPAVAFDLAQITSAANRTRAEPGLPASTLAKASRMHVAQTMAVRRLTPRECERLQGFPDDYTAVPHRGKPAADGPRYKAIGNSMAVPVMRWIGERIDAVERLRGAG